MDARLAFDLASATPVAAADRQLNWVDAVTDAARMHELIASHAKLVRKIAWHVHGRVSSAIDIEDLVQTGMMTLVAAARSFVDRGEATFATYAAMRVRGAMIDDLRRHATLCRSALRKRREIADARAEIEGAIGRPATDSEVARQLGLNLSAFRSAEAQTQAVRHESMDEVYSDHSIWFADDSEGADEQLDRERLRGRLTQAIADLPDRERQVLHLYFVEELNLEEIGQVLGVGGARICQIKRVALDKIRQRLASETE